MKTIAIAYLAWVSLLTVITLLFYGWDKRQSRINGWRTPESKLHWLAFLGGWPGAMVGQRFFRHKTQKFNFKFLTWTAALFHVVGITGVLYLWLNR